MDDLIAFIKARLTEREAKARAAGEIGTPDWHVGDDGSGDPESNACVIDGNGEIVVYDEGRPRLAEAVHIADNDPAWVLGDVESKRRVVDLHAIRSGTGGTWDTDPPAICNEDNDLHPCGTLRGLGFADAHHPDYLEAWKP